MSVSFSEGLKKDFASFKQDCIEYLEPEYVKNFPKQVPRKAVLSFASTAIMAQICGYSRYSSLALGSIAATSTLIEAVTRPVIKNYLPKNTMLASTCLSTLTFMPYRIIAGSLVGSVLDLTPMVLETDSVNQTVFGLFIWLKLLLANYGAYEKNEGFIAV